MTAAPSLARAELTMLVRNRTAVVTALLLPTALGLWLVTDSPADTPLADAAGLATIQLITVIGFTLITAATTTLVARRQQRVLERWRTTPTPTWAILAGTTGPLVGLTAAQATILLAATAVATGTAPAQPALLAVGGLLGGALGAALGFAAAALTRTVEAASVTTLPALIPLIGGAVWTTTQAGPATWPMRATGGGALTELVRLSWNGPHATTPTQPGPVPAVLVLLALTAAIGLVAARTFRWHARG